MVKAHDAAIQMVDALGKDAEYLEKLQTRTYDWGDLIRRLARHLTVRFTDDVPVEPQEKIIAGLNDLLKVAGIFTIPAQELDPKGNGVYTAVQVTGTGEINRAEDIIDEICKISGFEIILISRFDKQLEDLRGTSSLGSDEFDQFVQDFNSWLGDSKTRIKYISPRECPFPLLADERISITFPSDSSILQQKNPTFRSALEVINAVATDASFNISIRRGSSRYGSEVVIVKKSEATNHHDSYEFDHKAIASLLRSIKSRGHLNDLVEQKEPVSAVDSIQR